MLNISLLNLLTACQHPIRQGEVTNLGGNSPNLFSWDHGAGQFGVKISSVFNSFHGHVFWSDDSRSSSCLLRRAHELLVSLIPIINSDHCAYIKWHSNSTYNC